MQVPLQTEMKGGIPRVSPSSERAVSPQNNCPTFHLSRIEAKFNQENDEFKKNGTEFQHLMESLRLPVDYQDDRTETLGARLQGNKIVFAKLIEKARHSDMLLESQLLGRLKQETWAPRV